MVAIKKDIFTVIFLGVALAGASLSQVHASVRAHESGDASSGNFDQDFSDTLSERMMLSCDMIVRGS